MSSRSESGQAAVEAALALPLLLTVFGLFLQPAVLLYDRCVMESAAAEACRVVATQTTSESAARAYVLRRLGAVPDAPVFHRGGANGWQVDFEGGELTGGVSVSISHTVQPLPLLGITAGLAADAQSDGSVSQHVRASSSLQPEWAVQLGTSPGEWMMAWE